MFVFHYTLNYVIDPDKINGSGCWNITGNCLFYWRSLRSMENCLSRVKGDNTEVRSSVSVIILQ